MVLIHWRHVWMCPPSRGAAVGITRNAASPTLPRGGRRRRAPADGAAHRPTRRQHHACSSAAGRPSVGYGWGQDRCHWERYGFFSSWGRWAGGDGWLASATAAAIVLPLGGEEPPLSGVLPAPAADPSASARERPSRSCLSSWPPPSVSTGLCVLVGFSQDDAAADVDHV